MSKIQCFDPLRSPLCDTHCIHVSFDILFSWFWECCLRINIVNRLCTIVNIIFRIFIVFHLHKELSEANAEVKRKEDELAKLGVAAKVC